MHPEYLYWLMVAIVAMPLAAVSRVAGVITLVLVLAIFATHALGLDPGKTYFWLHLMAFFVAIPTSRSFSGIAASALFFSMAAIDLSYIANVISEYRWWWSIYFVAMFQLAVLIGMMDRMALRSKTKTWVSHVKDLWLRFTAPGMA